MIVRKRKVKLWSRNLLMMMENDINSLANSSRRKNDIRLPHMYLHMIKSKTLMALGPWGVKWLGQNNFGRVISYAINVLTRHSKIYMYFAHSQLKLSHYHWKCYLFQARPKYYAYFENAWSWGHSLARLLFFERHLRNVGIKSDAQNGVTRGITRTYIL